MALYTYTGTLADLGGVPFPGAVPRLWVEADRDAMGPDGPIPSRKRVMVPVAANGDFFIALHASTDLTPTTGYTLRCDWLDGQGTPFGFAEWEFTAVAGGGAVAGMGAGTPVSVWFVGPPWPPGTPPGFYLDRFTNDVGRKQ